MHVIMSKADASWSAEFESSLQFNSTNVISREKADFRS